MIEFYPQIKWVHVAAVLMSGSLFLLRGLLVQTGRSQLALAAPVRYLSYTIDSVLLTAALMLATLLPKAMFANGWLWTKLGLLGVYIVLGTFALKRGRTPRVRFGLLRAGFGDFCVHADRGACAPPVRFPALMRFAWAHHILRHRFATSHGCAAGCCEFHEPHQSLAEPYNVHSNCSHNFVVSRAKPSLR